MQSCLRHFILTASLAVIALSLQSCGSSPSEPDQDIFDSEFRGDINLNGVPFEIADAVVFSNYFISGTSAFDIPVPIGETPGERQIQASDVNADGIVLTVADLVYLIRVIFGDALPLNKLAHNSNTAVITTQGTIVSTDFEMGAALFVFDGVADVELLQEGLDLLVGFRDGNTYALVAPEVSGVGGAFIATIHPGDVVSSNATLLSVEASTLDGAVLNIVTEVLPVHFALGQNYPNPFYPLTRIDMDIPFATPYTLTIFDTEGNVQLHIADTADFEFVTIEWNAHDKSSGVYLYTMRAGDFVDTKSMLLVK